MKTYETSATVQDRGEVRVAGVPFAPGTEVEVTISPKPHNGGTLATPPKQEPTGGLRWQGNVLVHDGAGPPHSESHAELDDEHLGGEQPA
jgi:hypothetical protein